eukprot:COSAG06_NODE_67991_length_244_cov_50.531034_1_plen_39_part_10
MTKERKGSTTRCGYKVCRHGHVILQGQWLEYVRELSNLY